uniref:Uncharacterized protein n=1 Tax=Romanomermis culicivorax TaxID=13658 RepID=A0A915LAV9_ROMCU
MGFDPIWGWFGPKGEVIGLKGQLPDSIFQPHHVTSNGRTGVLLGGKGHFPVKLMRKNNSAFTHQLWILNAPTDKIRNSNNKMHRINY